MTDFTCLRFIAIFPDIPVDGQFILRDLPGSGKRIDVLCRSLAACFDWAPIPEIRSKLEFIVSVSHSVLMRFSAPVETTMRGETWWATIVRETLRNAPPDFVIVEERGLEEVLDTLQKEESNIYVLEEAGQSLAAISKTPSVSPYSFMLGDHRGFDERTSKIIRNLEIQGVSLGQRSYLGSHCVAAVISHFERTKK